MRKVGIAGVAVAALAVAAGAVVASCGQTPTNVPIRTFEGAQKVAVVCLKVRDTNGNPLPSVTPAAQSNCAPVAANVNTAFLPYHLYAAVTQTTRGELALVDLTSGKVVDEDLSTPGINFIPIGTNPTDVAESPDQSSAPAYTFVSSASPTKPALYAIDNTRILGDSTGTASAPLLLTDLRACSLPQQPLALAISSLSSGGATGGGLGFRIIALLAGGARGAATVATIDPSFAQTAVPGTLPACTILGSTALSARNIPSTWTPGPAWPDGVPYVDGGVMVPSASEPAIAPGDVCASTSVTPVPLPVGLGDAGALASDAGVVASDGGLAAGDADVIDAATADAGPSTESDGGAGGTDAAVPSPGEEADGGPDAALPLVLGPLSMPSPVSMVLRDDASRLYVADSALPVIHVLDVSVTPPKELDPILATSLQQPTRQVQVGGLALSPTTRDYRRYLYAIDEPAGSLMVFDVSDPALSPHVPLVRPHAELNPLLPADRLTFASPVATVAFVQHDWALQLPNDTTNAYQGLQCNPNPNAYSAIAGTFNDLGAHYRADLASTVLSQGTVQGFPNRLRGIFAFATLTDGTMVTVDVDDWDAPCRRFNPMSDELKTGELSVPQIVPPPGDLDPYHAQSTLAGGKGSSSGVTLEPFFPVSAPNRLRSAFLLRNDPTSGVHIPQITQSVSLVDGAGMQQSTALASGSAKPLLLPTVLDGFFDPSLDPNPTDPDPDPVRHNPVVPPATFPATMAGDAGAGGANGPAAGVRLAFDDPTVLTNQDWAVTYEGVLPGAQNILMNLSPGAGDPTSQTLTLQVGGGNLCAVGIEDASIGKMRAAAALDEMRRKQLVPETYDGPLDPKTGLPLQIHNPELDLATWTADYVEVVDDLLPPTDAYWAADNSCWDATQGASTDPKTGVRKTPEAAAADRYTTCTTLFGQYGSNADQVVTRDAPILEAYQDHLVTGFYVYPTIASVDGKPPVRVQATTSRTIATSGGSTFPRLMQCCFHSQASVKVRAGGEWIATGNTLGLLHHVKASDDTAKDGTSHACVLSCNPNDVLLNARSFDVPWAKPNVCTPVVGADPGLDRNNPLAMRNPMLSYVAWSGCGPIPAGDHTLATRDLSWRFSVSGGFTPQTIALSGTTGVSVSPQSMLFINSLGSLAVVDGAQQGLVLIDLNTVAFSANYF